ncbi:MAG: hypothetical protein U0325_05155 [Polyangiales bacterium]
MRNHLRFPSLHAVPWLLAVAVGVGCNGTPILGGLGDGGDAGASSDTGDVPVDAAPDVRVDVPRDIPPMDTPPTCATGEVVCNNACANLQTSAANCGACGMACPAGQACMAGRCGTVCPAGQQACAGGAGSPDVCANLQTDRSHCGACGMACAAGQVCANGMCALSCPTTQTNCSGTCRDVQTDPGHCGACGRACAAGQACASGMCVTSCAMGLTDCAGSCRDVQTDRAHCGAWHGLRRRAGVRQRHVRRELPGRADELRGLVP